jgi:enhancing lycopene biosynthesis protein 2
MMRIARGQILPVDVATVEGLPAAVMPGEAVTRLATGSHRP